MKKCFVCGLVKELDFFYRHPFMADGHLNKCVECTKAQSTLRYYKKIKEPGWIESERQRGRAKYKKYRYISGHKSDPFKKAVRALSSHIRGKNGIEFHHWSYLPEHAKDVIPLTISAHRRLHKKINYEDAHKCYSFGGELLNTKDKHLNFLINQGFI